MSRGAAALKAVIRCSSCSNVEWAGEKGSVPAAKVLRAAAPVQLAWATVAEAGGAIDLKGTWIDAERSIDQMLDIVRVGADGMPFNCCLPAGCRRLQVLCVIRGCRLLAWLHFVFRRGNHSSFVTICLHHELEIDMESTPFSTLIIAIIFENSFLTKLLLSQIMNQTPW